jgi:cell division protein FtsA
MEGIRDLAVATFGSIPVRIARPIEMNGLFEYLREPEYSTAVGLVMYSTSSYTPYEIDVNKKVRHSSEPPVSHSNVDFKSESETVVPVAQMEEKPDKMVSLPFQREKKSDEAGAFSKFWNWATQLF